MPDVLSVALLPGIHQEADRTMLPAGTLVEANNVRLSKGSAIAKTAPTIHAGRAVASYTKYDGTAVAGNPITGYVGEVTELQDGTQVLIADHRAYVRGDTGDEWVESGRSSRALPVAARWVQYDQAVSPDLTNPLLKTGVGTVSTAVQGDYVAVSYSKRVSEGGLAQNQCCLTLYGKNGIVLGTYVAGDRADYPNGRQNPRVVAADGVFLWIYQESTGVSTDRHLYVRRLDPVTKVLSSENAFISTSTAGDGYDAVAYKGGTEVLLVLKTQVGSSFAVSRFDASQSNTTPGFWSVFSTKLFTISGDCVFTVYGDLPASQIWVAYVAKDGSEARCVGYDGNLSAQVANLTFSAAPGTGFTVSQLGMVSRTLSSVWVVFTLMLDSPLSSRGMYFTKIYKCALGDGTGTADTVTILPHQALASRPFFGTSTSFQVWLHTDGEISGGDNFPTSSYAWRLQRGYGLYTVVMGGTTFDNDQQFAMVQPELLPEELSSNVGMRRWIPDVALQSTVDLEGQNVTHAFTTVLVPLDMGPTADALGVLLYEWETDIELCSRRRQVVEHAGGALVLGGQAQELAFDVSDRRIPAFATSQLSREIATAHGFENGFARAPAIMDCGASNDLSASLIAGAIYQVCTVYEQVDALGRVHRSRPSQVFRTIVPDATSKILVFSTITEISDRLVASDARGIVLHVYCSQGDKSVLHRVTPSSGVPDAWNSDSFLCAGFEIAGWSDADIAFGPLLYTEGKVIRNLPAPPHRFGCAGAGRVWLGGLFDPRVVECSKLEIAGEPTQFTRHPAFRSALPDPCTGLAILDNNLVAFTRTRIYTLPASVAPNNQGSPALQQFQPLPSTIGCINPWSVRVVADGVLFQSRRGLYILPRGFGRPELISEQVQDEIQGRLVTSTAVVDEQDHLLVLSCVSPTNVGEEDGRLLVYDLDRRQWVSSDDPGTNSGWGALVASWNGRLALATRQQFGSDQDIRVEDPTGWATNLSDQGVSLTLADLRPFDPRFLGGPGGLMGWGKALRLQVLGEVRGSSTLSITLFLDGKYETPVELPSRLVTGTAGNKFIEEFQLPIVTTKLNSLGLKIDVTSVDGEDPNEGLIIHAVSLLGEALPGVPKTGREGRAA